MRISVSSSQLPAVRRGKSISLIIDGRTISAYEGELVSTVLLAEGIRTFSHKLKTGKPAGVYCGMGVCYECLVTINGVPNLRACQTPAADQMVIETHSQVRP